MPVAPPNRFPTLLERLDAARWRLPHSPVLNSPRGGPAFVLDPALARSILDEHELCSPSDVADDVISDQLANLEKPTKPTRLLHHALTNANGDVWERQRRCVGRAFAVDRATRAEAYAGFAVDAAMGLINEASDRSCKKRRPFSLIDKWMGRNRGGGRMDVRIFARDVAIQTLTRIVLGERHSGNATIIDALHGMVKDTLEPRRDEESSRESESIVQQLDIAVREAIEEIAKKETGSEDEQHQCPCLAERLLLHEQSRDGTTEHHLTRDEVVGNAHSALLAGIQTISTTLAGALLRLAERPNLQIELREGSLSGKEVAHEALRILPPVAGLPRVPKMCDLQITRQGEQGAGRSCTVRKGNVLVIDVLAFAHAQESPMEERSAPTSANTAIQDFPTLQFEPRSKRRTEAQPFGIGRRRCPAGILSVECIGAVLEAIASTGHSWSLCNSRDCVAGQHSRGGWYETICYRPTLTFGAPLMIRMKRLSDSAENAHDSAQHIHSNTS